MSPPENLSNQTEERAGIFSTTHWSVVLQAAQAESPEAMHALEHLCRAYWFPLYACVRRQGHGADDARDLTQEFFARLLEKNSLRHADPARGRFRTFLQTSLANFLIKEWAKARTARRGGAQPWDPLESTCRHASLSIL